MAFLASKKSLPSKVCEERFDPNFSFKVEVSVQQRHQVRMTTQPMENTKFSRAFFIILSRVDIITHTRIILNTRRKRYLLLLLLLL